MMDVFGEAHATAVSVRAAQLVDQGVGGPDDIYADFGRWRSTLNTRGVQSALRIDGGGPQGGDGRTDLALGTDVTAAIWEMKFSSSWGHAAADAQLFRYTTAVPTLTRGPFFQPVKLSGTSPSGMQVAVFNGLTPGVQLYEIQGDRQYVYELAAQRLKDKGVEAGVQAEDEVTYESGSQVRVVRTIWAQDQVIWTIEVIYYRQIVVIPVVVP